MIWHEWRDAPDAEFAVIGDPVSHSLSPVMQMAALRALGRSERYVPLRVPKGEVAEAVTSLCAKGYLGLNVTVPLKEEAFSLFDCAADPVASVCGAVNTLDNINKTSANTDGPGFIDSLADDLTPTSEALILGAGGTAKAIALVLHLAGYNVHVFNRTRQRAVQLALELGSRITVADTPDIAGKTLIVNATSASLEAASLPLDWANADKLALAYDVAYGESPFLQEAASHGLRTLDGKELLVAQGARSLKFWLGVEAPRDVMRQAIA